MCIRDRVGGCKEYVGIDFSSKLLEKARRDMPEESTCFMCLPAQYYCEDDKYDLILVIGLMSYLDDEDIARMAGNCRKMLAVGGRLIVRNITLTDNSCSRKVYDYQPNALLRLLGETGYQVIRRSREVELSFFGDFHLIHEQQIKDTGYTLYVFV